MDVNTNVYRPVTLGDKALIDGYMYRWGEGSCQHSFTAMYTMTAKYADEFREEGGFLTVHRAGRETDTERIYLMPMGDPSDEAGLRRALIDILNDAHASGRRVRFETLTASGAAAIEKLLPGRFTFEPSRDWSEYIYTRERLAELSGPDMRSRRHEVNAFYNRYGDRARIVPMDTGLLDEVRAFQEFWMASGQSNEEDVQLELENTFIQKGLDHFEELGLSGIVAYVDGVFAGYAYGAPLSHTHYDVLIEKGDRRYDDIYRVLNREIVRMCCGGFTYINREEDVGEPGLRKAKMSYKPDILMEKIIAREAAE